ncbi:MAG: hypothetical protein MK116_14360, partial [Phycisphaerales bacterium]|nr:hypothetical protein [Phycisphaerales bacterium]
CPFAIVQGCCRADVEAMPRMERRSKLQRVSRFDATARPRVEVTPLPRIDVEPAEPPRGHLVHRMPDPESAPQGQVAAPCLDDDELDRSCAATSSSGGPVAIGLHSGRSCTTVAPSSFGNRLLEAIAWSLLLWIPVCVWLAIQVRL